MGSQEINILDTTTNNTIQSVQKETKIGNSATPENTNNNKKMNAYHSEMGNQINEVHNETLSLTGVKKDLSPDFLGMKICDTCKGEITPNKKLEMKCKKCTENKKT